MWRCGSHAQGAARERGPRRHAREVPRLSCLLVRSQRRRVPDQQPFPSSGSSRARSAALLSCPCAQSYPLEINLRLSLVDWAAPPLAIQAQALHLWTAGTGQVCAASKALPRNLAGAEDPSGPPRLATRLRQRPARGGSGCRVGCNGPHCRRHNGKTRAARGTRPFVHRPTRRFDACHGALFRGLSQRFRVVTCAQSGEQPFPGQRCLRHRLCLDRSEPPDLAGQSGQGAGTLLRLR